MPVVVITGCSSGFGEAMAEAFAARGFQVVATMRNPAKAPASLQGLAQDRPSHFVLSALDITDAASRKAAVKLARGRFGRIDVLVNNAGITARGGFEDTPEGLLRRIYETNLFGPMELARLFLPVMRAQGSGRIINVTSVAAALKTPFLGAYCASKAALDTATATLDLEARSFGVRALCLMPGPFRTALPHNSLDQAASAPYAEVMARFNAAFDALEAHAPEDITPVVEAALAAATDPDPQPRYFAGTDTVPVLPPILEIWKTLRMVGLRLTGQD